MWVKLVAGGGGSTLFRAGGERAMSEGWGSGDLHSMSSENSVENSMVGKQKFYHAPLWRGQIP
jgi:hypothetical protein